MKKILVIGATSAIAEATARIWAQRGDELFLVARNEERLNLVTKDLKVRGRQKFMNIVWMRMTLAGTHQCLIRHLGF